LRTALGLADEVGIAIADTGTARRCAVNAWNGSAWIAS
jgi:hypothetical protein